MTMYFSFATIVTLIVVSPGPNLFLLLKNAPTLGMKVGLLNTLGICASILCHATLSVLGVSAIVLASSMAFSIVKLLGAAYLIYLGVLALRDAWRGVSISVKLDARCSRVPISAFKALSEGWLAGMLNPKPSMFYLAAFPQFLDPSGNLVGEGLALGALHAAIAALWYGFVVVGVDQVRAVLRRPAVARGIKGVTGLVLIGFGARLVFLRAPSSQ